MRTLWNTRICGGRESAGVLIALALASPLVAGEPKGAEQIGEVLGKPVYRHEIRTTGNVQLRGELHRLFTLPVMEQYRRAHRAETEPTEEEITAATAWFDKKHRERIKEKEAELRMELEAVDKKLAVAGLAEEERRKLEIERRTLQAQLAPPGRFFAEFVLASWKFQRHLYDRYGGGRVLWQQAGLEAFDAMHRWLLDEEKQGQVQDHRSRAAVGLLRLLDDDEARRVPHGRQGTDSERVSRARVGAETACAGLSGVSNGGPCTHRSLWSKRNECLNALD
jgi:hypothetical protein